MEPKLKLEYDRIGDILYIEKVHPYLGQESDMIDDGIVARSNPQTGEIESLEILSFVKILHECGKLELPIDASLGLLPEVEEASK